MKSCKYIFQSFIFRPMFFFHLCRTNFDAREKRLASVATLNWFISQFVSTNTPMAIIYRAMNQKISNWHYWIVSFWCAGAFAHDDGKKSSKSTRLSVFGANFDAHKITWYIVKCDLCTLASHTLKTAHTEPLSTRHDIFMGPSLLKRRFACNNKN